MSKIVIADWDNSHVDGWLRGFAQYLVNKGFDVVACAMGNWHREVIKDASMVFVWNGVHDIYKPAIQACDELNIPYNILEVGWFPQKRFYFVDPTGINCRSSIVNDDLSWVGDKQFEKLAELRSDYLQGRIWKGGDYVLVPLQLEHDMNWVLDSPCKKMQGFIDHVEERFAGRKIVFKRHPLDGRTYRSNSEIVTKGDFLDMAQDAALVYGVNSTCLLESALMGVPVKSIGGGYLKAHENDTERLLAALADKQIPVGETDLDYWFEKVLPGYVPLTVVVSCYNQLKTLPLFLESMENQERLPDRVIVADDGSTDGVGEWLRRNSGAYSFPIEFCMRDNAGYRLASLNNMGCRNVKSGRILFTNADVIHSPESVKGHVGIKGVGGGVVKGISFPASKSVGLGMSFKDLEVYASLNPSNRHNLGYIEKTNPQIDPIGVWGGNFSVDAVDFHKVGGFDENFKGWGGEDNDLVRRLPGSVGWVMRSVVYHLDHPVQDYAYKQTGSKYYVKKLTG